MISGDEDKWMEGLKYVLGTGGLAAGVLYVGRMIGSWSIKRTLESTKDRTETDIVSDQYSRIRELEAANKDLTDKYVAKVAELGEVKGEVRALSMQSEVQKFQIDALKKTIEQMQDQLNGLMMLRRHDDTKPNT